jgi:hypothetical protein
MDLKPFFDMHERDVHKNLFFTKRDTEFHLLRMSETRLILR